MPQFHPAQIQTFTIPGDVINIYCMISEAIITEAKSGLTAPQQAVVESYRFVPSALQLSTRQVSTWAGNDPPAAYFRAPQAQMQAALAKYWA